MKHFILLFSMLFATTSLAAPTPPAPRERVLILAFKADGVDGRIVESIERAAVSAATTAGYDALSSQDLATIVDIEAARQAAGCDNEVSCLAEIAGGMGASLVVTGTVVKIDRRKVELALVLLDKNATTIRNRVTVDAESASALRDKADDAVRLLFGGTVVVDNTLPWVAIAGGSAVAVGGAVVAGVGLYDLVIAQLKAADASAAAARYADSGDRAALTALAEANDDYTAFAARWNKQGVAMTIGGGVAIAAGVAAIVVGVVGLE